MSNKPYYIFLIDDDEDDRDLFKDALREISIKTEVVSFNNGLELMAQLEDENNGLPQIIFLDLHMPIIGGEDCLKKIRKNAQFNGIPVVIYSTYYIQQMANRLMGLGANLYIQKPSSFSLLKSILERCIIALLENKVAHEEDTNFILKENEWE